MPKKYSNDRTQFTSKRSYRKKKGGLTKTQKKQVKMLIEDAPEKKFYDKSFTDVDLNLIPLITDVTDVGFGIGSTERIGVEIKLDSIQWNLIFKVDDGLLIGEANIYRFIVFQWFNDSSNDLPQWEQILQYGLAGSLTQTQMLSPMILDQGNSRCFKILHSEIFYSDLDNPVYMSKGFINKGFKKDVGLNQNAGITTRRGPNHIYFMLLSDKDVISPNFPKVLGYTRIRYTDA